MLAIIGFVVCFILGLILFAQGCLFVWVLMLLTGRFRWSSVVPLAIGMGSYTWQ